MIRLGSGFLINDDGPNLGKGPADGALNRGGAYYLAARHAFDRTAVLRLGGQEGLHGSVLWLKSDNRAQAETELAAGTLDYTAAAGTLGLTWVHGMNVTDQWASDFQKQREGLDTYSVRGEGSAGIDNASFAFEYAWQDKDAGPEKAWYAEAGYTFAESHDADDQRVATNQPQHLFKLATNYRLPEEWRKVTVGGNLYWQSSSFFKPSDEDWYSIDDPSAKFEQKSYALVGLVGGYDFAENLKATVNVNNLFDKEYLTTTAAGLYGAPRNVMTTVRYAY